MNIQIVNKSNNSLPRYETQGASGMDVRADLRYPNYEKVKKFSFNCCVYKADEEVGIDINPGGRCLIPTGLFVSIPFGYEIQVRPRSGLSAKSKLRIANSPGTIDSDYLGEIGIIIDNISDIYHHLIKKGERIAQLVLKKVEQIEWEEVEEFSEMTERNTGGFGSTGK